MKTFTTLLFTILIGSVYSQGFWNLDFEDTSQFFRLEIDTHSNHHNVWQIGTPQKTVFTSAHSIPNVIVTNTLNPVSANDTSVFYLKHVRDNVFMPYHYFSLSFWYQMDGDSTDFGTIEISPDTGHTWINILTQDTTFQMNWYSPKPTLTGSTNGWQSFDLDMMTWASDDDTINPSFPILMTADTILFRFTYITDSSSTPHDGWMIDDFSVVDLYEGINTIQNQIVSKSFPNPTLDIVTIEFENIDNSLHEVTVFNEKGQQILLKKTTNQSKFELNLKSLYSGIYYYKLINLRNNQISFGKIVKE